MKRTKLKAKFRINNMPRIELHGTSDELIILSNCIKSEIIKALMRHNDMSYNEVINYYEKVSSENNYNDYDYLKVTTKEI